MSLKHSDIWRAIDRLAERHGYSPSGLARKAGLSPTIFNASKRATASRKRWPSTESIAHILRATGTDLDEFVALASADEAVRMPLRMIDLEAAQRAESFDEEGQPAGNAWQEIPFPAIADGRAFAIEIMGADYEPAYRDGDRVIVSPAEKPRRGDRIVLLTKQHGILIGWLGRENTRLIEIIPFHADRKPAALAPDEVEWMYRIIWATQ